MDYVVITPVRNEATNLPRLAQSLVTQTVRPRSWIIVDNGSTDGTLAIAKSLAQRHAWVGVVEMPGEATPVRGAPVVRAFHAGLERLGKRERPDVVVKLDADVSFAPNHFQRLLAAFEADASLGLAGSTCWELQDGEWRPQYTTRAHVRGAVRAYRSACLDDVLPLVEGMGWDGIDELKAAVKGWRTATLPDLRFDHHRALGGRERSVRKWLRQGEMAHFMGYRPSYLVLRALFRARSDLAALAMPWGYLHAVLARRPRYDEDEVRAYLRREQSLGRLRLRLREARGRGNPRA